MPGESHGQEESGELQSIELQRSGQDWSGFAHTHVYTNTEQSPFSRGCSLPFNWWALSLRLAKTKKLARWSWLFNHRLTSFQLNTPRFFLLVIQSKVKVKSLSHVRVFANPWTVAYQVPLSMGFSRQEYWSGLPFSSPGDLSDPGIEPRSPAF